MDFMRGMHYNRNLNMIHAGFCGAIEILGKF